MSERSYHGATSRSLEREIAQWVHPMKDRSDDPSHHERTLWPRSYISLHEGSIRRPIAPWANALATELHLAPWRIDPTTHSTMSERSDHGATSRSMKDRRIRRPIAPWANALTTELHLAPWRIDQTTHRTMSERSYHGATSRSLEREIAQWVNSHHEGSTRRPIAPWANALTTDLHLAPWNEK